MAEFVEFRSEEWIRELEQMERIHLFDKKEIKTIATKRREFEYKIQRKTKHKEDFLKYVQFEVDLYRIVKARRENTKINTKRAEIDHCLTHRIAGLFKQAIFKFQDDVKLWMSFFKFCEEVKFYSLVSQMLVRMLQIHSDKPSLWVFASKWELEQCDSIDNARQFLTRGLRYHSSSDILYNELFKLELEFLQKKAMEKEEKIQADEWISDEVTDSIINGKLVEIVYESAIKNIKGVDFKVSLLNIAKNYKGATDIQNKIFEDILKFHAKEEITWQTIAKREFEGISCNISHLIEENESMEIDFVNESENKSLKERIKRSINIYKEAVKKLNTIKMWNFYLDFVIEINEDNNSLPVFKFKLLQNALEDALSSNKMDEKYFLYWTDLLRKTGKKNKKISEILKKATEQHPKSLKLWFSCLRFHLSRDQEEEGTAVFNKAVEELPDSLSLWKLMAQYLNLKSSAKAEQLFKDGLQKVQIAQGLKPHYIEWLVLVKGIEFAREAFESSEMQHPPCLELYDKMISVELNQPEPCLKKIRKCHEFSCKNFGQNNINVWLDYIKFELKQGDLTEINQIYRRALKNLEPEEADKFVSEYNFIKMNF